MSNKHVDAFADAPTRNHARLSPHVYDALVKLCPKPVLTPGQADPHYAAYALGVQHVLSLLREGFLA